MNDTKNEQPAVWVEEETPLEEALTKMTDEWIEAGNYCEETIATLRDACKWLLAGRAAAVEPENARDERGTRSVQRLGRLLARWRAHYDNLRQAAEDMAHEHPAMAVVRRECAHEVLMCIHDLKAELGAGEEPTK